MASLLLPTLPEKPARAMPAPSGTTLVVGFGTSPLAAEYARQAAGAVRVVDLRRADALDIAPISQCVLFLDRSLHERDWEKLDALLPLLSAATFVGVVSSFRVHLGDARAANIESHVVDRLKGAGLRPLVFRAANIVLSAEGNRWRKRFGFIYPLVPRRWRSCFVPAPELFACIDKERQERSSRPIITLLGPNRPLRDMLREERGRGVFSTGLCGFCHLLGVLLVGQLIALLLYLIPWTRRALSRRLVHTLEPASFAELLALCNPHNSQHVKVVGYNNGVNHFGQRFPGKTVVSTVRLNRILRADGDIIRADCGATIRDARLFLAAADQELHVLPNYSYVCLGTSFFVPIHGSASDYTTVAETVVKALLYDPANDRFFLARRDDPVFCDNLYNPRSRVLVLRLWMRVKAKTRYFASQEERDDATGEELLAALRDPEASNVEIRKAKAASHGVRISKYVTETLSAASDETALEVPHDSLGRIWDRLEENALTSFLMHAATRYFAWHVELFLTAEQFLLFWRTHQTLPLRKMQLRYIRRDGFPNSPFRDEDCVSVDLFMIRWNRQRFETYVKETFGTVRTNPGKHSQ